MSITGTRPMAVLEQQHLLDGHTELDAEHLAATRTETQPREHRVPCQAAGCRETTWNSAGRCDSHYLLPAAAMAAIRKEAR